jgi:hypothetical protein
LLLYAGLLVSLPAALQPLVQSAMQPRQTHQQQRCRTQQQQATADDPRVFGLRSLLNAVVHVLLIMDEALQRASAQQRSMLSAALPLLQQLQRCVPLLMAASAGAGPGAAVAGRGGSSSSSSSSRESNSISALQQLYIKVQLFAIQLLDSARVLHFNKQLDVEAMPLAATLLCDPAVTELLLQALAGHAMLFHKEHEDNISAQQQQQQQQRNIRGHSSMLSHKKHRADLLSIPAFHQHQDMLQLLPGGQVYLDAAAVLPLATGASSHEDRMGACRSCAFGIIAMLQANCTMPGSTGQALQGGGPLLSAAAFLLVLELQLLAAGAVQRLQTLHHSSEDSVEQRPDRLLYACNVLLQGQIVAVLNAGGSCLPSEVLQQAGLQLLQALAAPLQQLQLGDPDLPSVQGWQQAWGNMLKQLYVLQAAAGVVALPRPGREGEQVPGRGARICTCGLQAEKNRLAYAQYQTMCYS